MVASRLNAEGRASLAARSCARKRLRAPPPSARSLSDPPFRHATRKEHSRDDHDE